MLVGMNTGAGGTGVLVAVGSGVSVASGVAVGSGVSVGVLVGSEVSVGMISTIGSGSSVGGRDVSVGWTATASTEGVDVFWAATLSPPVKSGSSSMKAMISIRIKKAASPVKIIVRFLLIMIIQSPAGIFLVDGENHLEDQPRINTNFHELLSKISCQ